MIPFNRSWPYEIVGKDVYVSECPFCGAGNVLLPLRKDQLPDIAEGRKKLLVFPCCRNKLTVIDADRDYLLADKRIRKELRG